MGTEQPTAAEDAMPPPEWSLVHCGGYTMLLHQPRDGAKPQDPALLPLPPNAWLAGIVPRLSTARWPRGVPEFDDEIERYETTARWLTIRGAAALSYLAQGSEPPREVFELLHVTPFGYLPDDFDHGPERIEQAAAAGETLPTEPDLTMLTDRLPLLARPALVALSTRIRSALNPFRRPIMPVQAVTKLASCAVIQRDADRDGGHDWPLREREVAIETTAALMSAWHDHPQLRVSLACAYAVIDLLNEWVKRGYRNGRDHTADPIAADQMRLQTYDGPDPEDPVPAWARRLVEAAGDTEVWRG